MNEIAAALIDSPATLGLVPCGSGDGLGRHLGIHGSPAHAFAVLDRGETRLIDTGLANDRPFFTAAGIGFEAMVADRFNRLVRRGFVRYLTTSFRAFREWRPERYVVTHSNGREEIRAFTLTVANATQYGNNARIAPAARIDDGKLDLVAVPPITLFNAASLGTRLFLGGIDRASGIRSLSGPEFRVERERVGLLHTDGEIHSAGTTIDFKIRPASLRIMAGKN
jgi:diacylglycerol kinase family enzyme